MSLTIPRPLVPLLLGLFLSACAVQPLPLPTEPTPPSAEPPAEARPTPVPRKPRIGLALGGGAARGYAHIGVIKALEAQGIVPDFIAGTSAGAVVGALYASGLNGFQLQRLGMDLDEDTLADWSWPRRGIFKGEALQDFVNRQVGRRPLQRLDRPFAAVATDLKNGEMVVFRRGDTGMAVRASSAVPGIFKPVEIRDREYVDGGLTSPVPVRAVKAMGADFVIAVDVGNKPQWGQSDGTLDVLLRTFTIMGASIGKLEMAEADVVIRPQTPEVAATDFDARHYAILAGEKAAAGVMAGLKTKLEQARAR
ncbi:MAG TPA: patatin-like phospholipase family protein [Thiobacillaceae bacterium]|nr:patatin-like phospholipase family protein [Thiobacillaceae bacterium]